MPSRIDALVESYGRHAEIPWERGLAPAQRVWFAVYPKEEERRLRFKVEAFALATAAAGKRWVLLDLTDAFAQWIDKERHRDTYFRSPRTLEPKKDRFLEDLARTTVERALTQAPDDDTVIALLGVAGLFGCARVSDLVPKVVEGLPGRLLVFFPGSRDGNTYRLLDAREGWNYLAVPITAFDEGSAP